MTRIISYRPAARRDLSSIATYTDKQWGRAQVRSYLAEVAEAINRIAANPLVGSDCADLAPGYRKIGVGSHNIFYRHDDAVLDVVRILHQRMDFVAHLR